MSRSSALTSAAKLPRNFYEQATLEVSRELLGKYLVRVHRDGTTAGQIVETEAYIGPDDKACHASKGRTPRTEIMFGPPGHAYVYLIYGFHYLLNFVTEGIGVPAVVLIRAVEPREGIELMQLRRHTTAVRNLCSGPGKLCQAFAIDRSHNGSDICAGELYVEDRCERVKNIATTPRIGIDYAGKWKHNPWRFFVRDSEFVSKR
ncbi:MAG: DNA-3-methyladenine glycosylase [Deltaproteobacteria bacterium]|nr:DNA-3-methyladenine glycosylase [Deltaproteobacteria bacterium]